MTERDNFEIFWSNVAHFLNQQELCTLAQTSSTMSEIIVQPRLYRSIHVTKNPVQRVPDCYLDCGMTFISGYRAITKSDNQNDLYLYDRIEQFLYSMEKNSQHIKEVIIDSNLFSDKSDEEDIINRLISSVITVETIESITVKSHPLFFKYSEQFLDLTQLRYVRLHNNNTFQKEICFPNLTSVKLTVDQVTPDIWSNEKLVSLLKTQIEEIDLELDDFEISSLDFLSSLDTVNIVFEKVRKLKFNLVHINNDTMKEGNTYGKEIARLLTDHFNISKIKKLEVEFCCHVGHCPCIDDFLQAVGPKLLSLESVALRQTLYQHKGDNQIHEDFDGSVGNFIHSLPSCSTQLRELCIHHDPPLNGIGFDTVEGNYYRRRRFYEGLFPNLKALEKLVVPQMLQSLSLYEIIACDILWNGCVCESCKKNLPQFDDYLMNHQYFSKISGKYEDVIPPVLFGYAGDNLDKRYRDSTTWELDALNTCPTLSHWNFHGYDNIHHFDEHKCHFDERHFEPLVIGVTHFFNDYMDHLVLYLPKLRVALLSGLYYTISPQPRYPFKNVLRRYKSIYD